MHTYMQGYTHACNHTHIQTYIQTCIHTYTHTYTHNTYLHTYIPTYIHTYIQMPYGKMCSAKCPQMCAHLYTGTLQAVEQTLNLYLRTVFALALALALLFALALEAFRALVLSLLCHRGSVLRYPAIGCAEQSLGTIRKLCCRFVLHTGAADGLVMQQGSTRGQALESDGENISESMDQRTETACIEKDRLRTTVHVPNRPSMLNNSTPMNIVLVNDCSNDIRRCNKLIVTVPPQRLQRQGP
jgi:hypothetical protein